MAEITFEEGSGNVFKDMDYAEPEIQMAKVELAFKIGQIIKYRHLTQTDAARLLRIDQPKVSKLMAGKVSGFSAEKLMFFLVVLGRDVTITVKKKPKSHEVAHMDVAYA